MHPLANQYKDWQLAKGLAAKEATGNTKTD